MGPAGPFFFDKRRKEQQMAAIHEKERQLQDEVGSRVEQDLPGVEVLAVELASPERFVVYVDHPEGVDHALCARVTDLLRDYLREYTVDVSSPATRAKCAGLRSGRSTPGEETSTEYRSR